MEPFWSRKLPSSGGWNAYNKLYEALDSMSDDAAKSFVASWAGLFDKNVKLFGEGFGAQMVADRIIAEWQAGVLAARASAPQPEETGR